MAVWYCGSVQHAAIVQWAALTAYSVGDIRRQLAAPTAGNERALRCTTAGTSGGSEPSWSLGKGATTADGTAVWTEVTGNSTYGWSAAFKRIKEAVSTTWIAAGDTVYVANDHSVSVAAMHILVFQGSVTTPCYLLCVNPAGSVPPVSADLTTGAVEGTTGANDFQIGGSSDTFAYVRGVTFQAGSGSSIADMRVVDSSGNINIVMENCSLVLNSTSSSSQVILGLASTSATKAGYIILKNTSMTFGATTQTILFGYSRTVWKDTPSAILGSVPGTLFTGSSTQGLIELDGVDLSAAGSGKTLVSAGAVATTYVLRNCKLGASVTVSAAPTVRGASVSLVNCDSGATGNRQERYTYEGTLTKEATIVLTGGASDGAQTISWKVVTTANAKFVFPFETFPIAVWNATTGSSVTATVEIVTDNVTLTDEECWVEAEYLGTSGFPISSSVSDAKADILASAANQTTSSATWTTTGLATPVTQKLSVTFTPQLVGYVRLVVKVAKASTTVYIDPKVTLS